MVKGTRFFRDPETGVRIQLSRPAQELIGAPTVPLLILSLKELMEALQVEQAYVSKRGAAVDVYLSRSDGWQGHMKIERRRRAWEKRARV